MARGINVFVGSGNVSGPIKYDPTSNGDAACSFVLVMDTLNGRRIDTTRVRVNVYGPLVSICEDMLHKGGYVSVEGELMNRERRLLDGDSVTLTEARARDIAFVD